MSARAWRRAVALVALLAAAPAAGAGELDEIRALADGGRREEALRRVEDALVRDPNRLDAGLLRGVLLVELGRNADAERVFDEMVRRNPWRPEPVNNLAVLRAASGRRALALAALEELVDQYPGYAVARRNLEVVRGLRETSYDPMDPDAERERLWLTGEPVAPQRVEPPPRPRQPVAVAEHDEPRPRQPAAAPEAEPPVVPVPAAEPAPVAPAPDPRAELETMVTAWAAAWAGQRVDDYLAFYSARFRPADGSSRAAWKTTRRRRLTAPRFIEVEIDLDTLRVEEVAPGESIVTFVQRYRSDRFADTVTKRLGFARENGAWRIVSEESG